MRSIFIIVVLFASGKLIGQETLKDSLGNSMNYYDILETVSHFDEDVNPYRENAESYILEIDDLIRSYIPIKRVEENHMRLYIEIYTHFYTERNDYNLIVSLSKIGEIYGSDMIERAPYAIGTSYYFLNQYDSAIVYLDKHIELNQLDHPAYNNRAWSYLALGETEKAANDFIKAYEIEPSDINNMNNYGYALYLQDDLSKAKKMIKQSIKKDHKNSFCYRNLGLIYMKMGKSKKACLNLQKAIDLGIIENWGASYIEELNSFCNENRKD